ncbi:hypothetical protein BDP55DRAFT_345176 [Colletotrichum godetiae]|uniref:Uncharacterized protein n=1 Tax=Colletotrichum godetiae TaxID=1209918 RepID=A0AAJ0ATZ5_9PEZI|nr:uncharacterized protein BDP55DRAFT_345176 [Colletotrichum godetiae]KAK1690318.1 hypothetical protein BDP55DRAFT_345176 [Colletotrichum godetiae]
MDTGTNIDSRDPTMSLPLQVNQREKLLATRPSLLVPITRPPPVLGIPTSYLITFAIPSDGNKPHRGTTSAMDLLANSKLYAMPFDFSYIPTCRDTTLQTSSGVRT